MKWLRKPVFGELELSYTRLLGFCQVLFLCGLQMPIAHASQSYLWGMTPGSGYVNGKNFAESEQYCRSKGGVLASKSQLIEANRAGFSMCAVGWLQGGVSGYVMRGTHAGCGADGWNARSSDKTKKLGAYCIASRAPAGENAIALVSSGSQNSTAATRSCEPELRSEQRKMQQCSNALSLEQKKLQQCRDRAYRDAVKSQQCKTEGIAQLAKERQLSERYRQRCHMQRTDNLEALQQHSGTVNSLLQRMRSIGDEEELKQHNATPEHIERVRFWRSSLGIDEMIRFLEQREAYIAYERQNFSSKPLCHLTQ